MVLFRVAAVFDSDQYDEDTRRLIVLSSHDLLRSFVGALDGIRRKYGLAAPEKGDEEALTLADLEETAAARVERIRQQLVDYAACDSCPDFGTSEWRSVSLCRLELGDIGYVPWTASRDAFVRLLESSAVESLPALSKKKGRAGDEIEPRAIRKVLGAFSIGPLGDNFVI